MLSFTKDKKVYFITNIRDFYAYFDIKQALKKESEVLDFAEKNLLCMAPSETNTYCIRALHRAINDNLIISKTNADAELFWRLGATVPHEFNLLNDLFDWFLENEDDKSWFPLYVKTAALLILGKQDINLYVNYLYSDSENIVFQGELETNQITNDFDSVSTILFSNENAECSTRKINESTIKIENISLSSRINLEYKPITGAEYSYYYYPKRKLDSKDKIRTVELCALEDNVTITFIPSPADAGVEFAEKIPAGSSIFVNALGCNIVSVLKNEASFEQITLRREKDGIYAYDKGKRLGNEPRLPSSVSSFAVLGRDAYLYIKDGELKYTPNVSSVNSEWYSMADIFVEVGNDGNGAAVILDDRGRVFSYSVKTAEKTTSLSQLLK